ncbi:MAG: bifunctional phosphoribosylaminoimidazolecarboxamide formyltransferase/IMP cyclohydrolase [Elusimicrobia bacterium]|nr:bifunctional phosphoribosylaminoimidazolecarboxamide formyltransferase/IMP cyclohydrolase [Elusimicrobiota bacterium]
MKKGKTALISVSDKTGVVEFAKGLQRQNVRIISTGGSLKILQKAGIKAVSVESITGFPEVLGGRVKTLHPKIHAGILAMRNKKHLGELKKLGIDTIDIVVVNLYPFEESPSIENIDIGGVALLRAAAKNFKDILVVCDPNDYSCVIENIKKSKNDISFKKNLMAKAFRHTAYYDSVISNYFSEEKFPEKITVGLKKISSLRYGENPHQQSAIYQNSKLQTPNSNLKQLQGKELSYNNYIDLDSAFNLASEFKNPSCVIVKHCNPCGTASAKDIFTAYGNALVCDPVSAFGGIVAFNRAVDGKTAAEVIKTFTECIIAPFYSKDALKVFAAKRNLRVLVKSISRPDIRIPEVRSISDGVLVSDKDIKIYEKLKVVTEKKPTKQELESLEFAFTVAKWTKSNAIILVKGTQTVGVGAGQMSRIDALKIASIKMQSIFKFPNFPTSGSLVLASDAFFPFRDVVDESTKIGVTSIIQPGGSTRDADSISACNEHGISMVFTGLRHFRH